MTWIPHLDHPTVHADNQHRRTLNAYARAVEYVNRYQTTKNDYYLKLLSSGDPYGPPESWTHADLLFKYVDGHCRAYRMLGNEEVIENNSICENPYRSYQYAATTAKGVHFVNPKIYFYNKPHRRCIVATAFGIDRKSEELKLNYRTTEEYTNVPGCELPDKIYTKTEKGCKISVWRGGEDVEINQNNFENNFYGNDSCIDPFKYNFIEGDCLYPVWENTGQLASNTLVSNQADEINLFLILSRHPIALVKYHFSSGFFELQIKETGMADHFKILFRRRRGQRIIVKVHGWLTNFDTFQFQINEIGKLSTIS